jgi:hypothetical protein
MQGREVYVVVEQITAQSESLVPEPQYSPHGSGHNHSDIRNYKNGRQEDTMKRLERVQVLQSVLRVTARATLNPFFPLSQ